MMESGRNFYILSCVKHYFDAIFKIKKSDKCCLQLTKVLT